MKQYTQRELNDVIGRNIGDLRAVPGFTGVYITEFPEQGAHAVVQLHPMTEAAQQKVRDLYPECPLLFRNIGIAKAL